MAILNLPVDSLAAVQNVAGRNQPGPALVAAANTAAAAPVVATYGARPAARSGKRVARGNTCRTARACRITEANMWMAVGSREWSRGGVVAWIGNSFDFQMVIV